ncbi:MAG: hypothetical protein EB142_03260, partial [Actinobacteria bacterium]|nr:hypothetical protein [Actinomycetota bacterium]
MFKRMKLFLRRNAPLFYVLAVMLALYIPWLNRGYTNLEYAFPMAANGLSDFSNSTLIDAYWSNQANPLGYSLFLAAIYKLLGYRDWFWMARLPSIVGIGLMVLSGWILFRDRLLVVRSNFYSWSALLILNPMIIAYSTAATADILPVGLLMLSILLILKANSTRMFLVAVSAVMFGLSVVTKYNSAYFGMLFLVALSLATPNAISQFWNLIKKAIWFLSFPVAILIAYIWWSYSRFDVFISNRLDQTRPNFTDIEAWLNSFGKYLAFLGLFCCLIPIVVYAKQFEISRTKIKHIVA